MTGKAHLKSQFVNQNHDLHAPKSVSQLTCITIQSPHSKLHLSPVCLWRWEIDQIISCQTLL